MIYNFKKLNSKVLSFDPIKDIDKIRFNHYIMRKENKNRLTGELENGKFKMTIRTVMEDLNFSKGKSERMINEFEKMGIIKSVFKGNRTSGYSIYEYITESKCGADDGTGFENGSGKNNCENKIMDKCDDMNTCNNNFYKESLHSFGTGDDIGNGTDSGTSKIDNINIYLNINNNICDNVIDYLNKATKKNFRKNTPKTRKLINTRLKEGFVEEDFYAVIDIKASQWLHSDMEKYLRPETLFSNKFEGYLNETSKKVEEVEETGYWDIEFDF